MLLAALPTSRAKAATIAAETKKVIGNSHSFTGEIIKEEFIDAGEEEKLGNTTVRKPVTTFNERLIYQLQSEADFIDLAAAVDLGNTLAKADIILSDGTTLTKDVPVATLLFLEGRLGALKTMFQTIPTRASEYEWNAVVGEKDLFERADIVKVSHHRDEMVPIQKTAATDKHPATAELVKKPTLFKVTTKRSRSTSVSSLEAAKILSEIDSLLIAVQKARAIANSKDVDVSQAEVGKKIYEHFLSKLKLG